MKRVSERRVDPRRPRPVAPAVLLLFFVAGAAPAAAQHAPSSGEEIEAFHLLDFWVGEWEVRVGDRTVGSNRIEKILNGCAVMEHWTAAGGGEGKSLFYYDAVRDEWHQVWVTGRATSTGGLKEKRLVEVLEGGALRFQGEVPLADGGSYLDRTTLTPLDGGRVRQVIQVSGDGGETWRNTFDAVYVPAGSGSERRGDGLRRGVQRT